MSTDTVDWTDKYQELTQTLRGRYRFVDRELEEKAWRTVEPLSTQIWSIIREKLTDENHEELSRQAYCVAIQAVMYHVDNLETH